MFIETQCLGTKNWMMSARKVNILKKMNHMMKNTYLNVHIKTFFFLFYGCVYMRYDLTYVTNIFSWFNFDISGFGSRLFLFMRSWKSLIFNYNDLWRIKCYIFCILHMRVHEYDLTYVTNTFSWFNFDISGFGSRFFYLCVPENH